MRKVLLAALALFAVGVWTALAMKAEPRSGTDPARAIGDTRDLPPALQRAFDPAGFARLPKPGPSDWLANHPEPGQTYDQFVAGHFNRPDANRRKIYLQPIGPFPAGRSPALTQLADCAAAFFQLPVERLSVLDPAAGELTTRTNQMTGNRQVLATDVLDWLKRELPDDAYCLLGVTMLDLYPEPSWNFVFGMASIRERVGVFSFARYHPGFATPAAERVLGPPQARLMLRRSCKVLTHETGHMFGLLHCVHYECGMNGSNHLAESDARQIHLCPVCLRKLQQAVGFDVVGRYTDLEAFYRKAGLVEEADWVRARLGYINR